METAKLLVATYIEMGYEVIVVPPPSVSAVPARGREARKRKLIVEIWSRSASQFI